MPKGAKYVSPSTVGELRKALSRLEDDCLIGIDMGVESGPFFELVSLGDVTLLPDDG